jgi:hypothetical protein
MVLMPLANYTLPILFCKLLRPPQFLDLETLRFTKLNAGFNVEDGLTAAVSDVDVDRLMLVAVKEKPVAVLFKDKGH